VGYDERLTCSHGKVRADQWESSSQPHGRGGSDDDEGGEDDEDDDSGEDDDGDDETLELIVIGQRSVTSERSAVSGIDQSQDNLRDLLPPPGLLGNDVSLFHCFIL